MSLASLKDGDKASFEGRIHTCPLRGNSTSFQLVDEQGDGKPYAGLAYEVTDYEDVAYTGTLDANGAGKVDNHYCGPVVLKLNQPYEGQDKIYVRLKERKYYPLPITELQVRAERTRFYNKSGPVPMPIRHRARRIPFTRLKCVNWWTIWHIYHPWWNVVFHPTPKYFRYFG